MNKFCAYLDVLGFSDLLDDWDQAVSYYNDMQALLSEIVSWYQRVTENIERVMPEMQQANIEYCVFSDAIIITATKVSSLIFAVSDIQYHGLLKGYSFRGAISFGKHLDNFSPGKSLIVSQALRDAYKLESTYAKVPRILIDSKLFQELSQDIGISLNPDCLAQDEDAFWFINFLNGRNGLRDLANAIDKELRTHANDRRVYEKYLWLAQFFNFVVSNSHSRFKYDPNDTITRVKSLLAPNFLLHPYEGKELKAIFKSYEDNISSFQGQTEKKA